MYKIETEDSPYSIKEEYSTTISDTVDISEFRNDIISPKTARPDPEIFYMPTERVDQVALFQERILNEDKKVPIYNSRASYFFMNKMAVEGEGCYSICKSSCGICYKSKIHPFFVMPKYTQWIRLGDYGVVINLNTKEQESAYAICADLGPDETIALNNNTVFKGKIGEGSLALGKYLKIKDSELGIGDQAFQPNNMLYIVFPGSASYTANKIRTIKEINEHAHRYFQMWGGWSHAQFVVKQKYNIILK